MLGKAKRTRFNTATHITHENLSYIHLDLWGPSRTKTMAGARYFMTLINDKERKVWIYLLKIKDEELSVFKVWKQKV